MESTSASYRKATVTKKIYGCLVMPFVISFNTGHIVFLDKCHQADKSSIFLSVLCPSISQRVHSDAEFDAYYTGVKIDRFNVKIQLYKNRTLIPLIVHVQLIKIVFCLIEAPRFFSSMLNRFKKNIKYILKRIYILTFHLLILVIIDHLHL